MMPRLRTPPTGAAAELAHALGGKRSGHGWKCRCPAHRDSDPSLSIGEGDDGRVLVKCFAGCSQEAVIDALRGRGLWAGSEEGQRRVVTREEYKEAQEARRRERAKRIEEAAAIWNEGQEPRGTLAESYLKSRKLDLPDDLCGTALRFHPACKWETGTAPCLIAAFRSITSNRITAIHRVRLDQPERWPKAERKMLGPVGGSAVMLDPAGDRLFIGEGVETSMAARQLGWRPAWALGSAGAIEKFPPVAGVDHLTILGENDPNGTNQRAAEACRQNWKDRRVTILRPRRTDLKDHNDILMRETNAQAATHRPV